MNKILISYDLHKPVKDYEELYRYLKGFGTRAKPLESLWMVKTSKSHIAIRDEIVAHIDKDDSIIVIDVSGDAMAWRGLGDKVSEWLKNN